MRGMKSLVAPTKRQNYADGGVVGAIKGMFGIKPEDPERARRLAEYRANAAREKEAAKAATAPAPAPAPAITEYAAGSALKRREAAAGLKDGGPVRGPGTGTSDDVPDNVPEGTYIMPADSTRAIGEKTLGGLGMRGIDVNLSNGEFKLPPKQVQALGEAVLTVMRNATHQPADGQKEAPTGKGFTPHQFFADGGTVKPRGFVAGKGTGTSDSIPARLSNGEYVLPADTVKAVGVEALDSLRAATHTPVKHEQAKAAHGFFAGGTPGGVDEEKLKNSFGDAAAVARDASVTQVGGLANNGGADASRFAQVPAPIGTQPGRTPEPAAQPAAPAPTAAPVPAAPAPVAKDPLDGGAAFGVFPQLAGGKRTTYAMDEKLRTGVEATGPSTFVQATPLDKTIIGGGNGQRMNATQDPRSLLTATGTNAVAGVSPPPTPLPQGAAQPGSPAASASTGKPPDMGGNLPTPQPVGTSTAIAPGVYQHGRGQYSDNASGMGMPAGFTGQPNAQNMAAADALAGRSQQESMNRVTARGMGALAGGPGSGPVEPGSFTGGFSGVIGTDPRIAQQERERSALASALSSPLRGAQNGQLTASQRQGMAGLLDAERRDASSNRQADQTAATQRSIAAMREAGDNGRALLREDGENTRSTARNQIDARRYNDGASARAVDMRAAQRRESAYDNYSKAKTDEDRQAIAKQFPDLFGQAKDAVHRMEVVRGKTDPMTGQSSGDYVVVQDPKTGGVRQIQMGAGAAPAPQAMPKPASKAEFDALPKGTRFTDPNGQVRIK